MSSLAVGTYTIRSALPNGLYVGRHPVTKDQKIQARPQGSEPSIWKIEDAGYGRYYLKTDGFPTGVLGGGVYTILYGPAEKWDIEAVPQDGYNQFVIHTNNHTLGWVLPYNQAYTPVAAQPLAATKSIPPHYPATERWVIEKSLQYLD